MSYLCTRCFLLCAAVMACWLSVSILSGHSPNFQVESLSGEEVIDRVTITVGPGKISHNLLTVDKDDAIKTYLSLQEEGRATTKPEVVDYLGQRVARSGKLSLVRLLPRGQVPAIARRVTLTERILTHVVLTWGFHESHQDPTVWYSIYVFTEDLRTRSVRLAYSDKYVNRELVLFLVQDINQDGLAEIIDFGRSAKIGDARIRRLEPDGSVTLLQEMDAYDIHLLGPMSARHEYAIVLLEDEITPNQWLDRRCYSYKELRWSRERGHFVPKGQ